jgi:hypothetical protein
VKIINKIFLVLTLIALPTQLLAQALCTDSSQTSAYSTCVINEGFLACQTESPTCTYNNYYINPNSAVSLMINQCCKISFTHDQQVACFQARLANIQAATALPKRFRRQVKSIVNSYIVDPDLFCTEH